MKKRPFRLIKQHSEIGGVCGGLAYYFGWNVRLVRIFTALAMFFSGSIVFWGYIIVWLISDEWETDPADFDVITGDKIIS